MKRGGGACTNFGMRGMEAVRFISSWERAYFLANRLTGSVHGVVKRPFYRPVKLLFQD